jgi:2-keto-4-pentenoate hydratase/2-oxohepta-3-ene-1,7-dioic acid hydratase in catechol pathway
MRIAHVANRFAIIDLRGLAIDVGAASGGRFGPDPQLVYDDWQAFREWAECADLPAGASFQRPELGSPAPRPRQLFAIGLNYGAHAAESNIAAPPAPSVFTKFQSSITGGFATVTVPADSHVDWEVELVVVIGRAARNVGAADAWMHVAGVTVGQDLSERLRQMQGQAPQFSLGKSLPGFSPMGPWLVTPDELPNRDDLAIECELNGEVVQSDRTVNMLNNVPVLIEYLSGTLQLYPGDVVFTGTPSGVGFARDPKRRIIPGDTLVSRIEGIGETCLTFC